MTLRENISCMLKVLQHEFNISSDVVIKSFKKALEEVKMEEKSNKKSNDTGSTICSYTYQRGEKKGVRCELTVSKDSKLCSRHCKKNEDKKKDKNVNKKVETIKIINKLMKSKPTLEIKRNNFNNFETPNKLIYDIDVKEIIGYQNGDGTTRELTKIEIQWCKENNIKFRYPFNLSLEQTKVSDNEQKEEEDKEDEDKEASFDEDDDFYDEDRDEDEDEE
jgi:hypothetical protein